MLFPLSSSSFCFTNPNPSPCLNQNSFKGLQFRRPSRGIGTNLKCVDRSETLVRSSAKARAHIHTHTHNPNLSFSCLAAPEAAPVTSDLVADRVQRLAMEFGLLAEPIERVRQLLHYAALLPPLEEAARGPANRVTGCTTQVWLDAWLDGLGRVRFRADSDSEITKGFVSCLVWILDGADPAEVAAVRPEDLAAMNVGLYGKARSRVITWHNVLISMQKRAEALVAERDRTTSPSPEAFLTARYAKAQILILYSREKNVSGNLLYWAWASFKKDHDRPNIRQYPDRPNDCHAQLPSRRYHAPD